MGGEWIPVRKNLHKTLEVAHIASCTQRTKREVAAILIEFWCWADDMTRDGRIPLPVTALSVVCPGTDQRFWTYVAAAGWLAILDDCIVIPNFDYWLGPDARKRSLAAWRKRQSRRAGPNVRNVSRSNEDIPSTVADTQSMPTGSASDTTASAPSMSRSCHAPVTLLSRSCHANNGTQSETHAPPTTSDNITNAVRLDPADAVKEKGREERSPPTPSPKEEKQRETLLLTPTLPSSLDTPAFRQAWATWEQYRREKKKTLTPTTVKLQLKKLARWGEAKAIEALEESMSNGWTGVFEPDGPGRPMGGDLQPRPSPGKYAHLGPKGKAGPAPSASAPLADPQAAGPGGDSGRATGSDPGACAG